MIDEFNSVSMVMSTQNSMFIEWSTLIKDENCFQSTMALKSRLSPFFLSLLTYEENLQPELNFHLALSFGNLILHILHSHVDCISYCLVSRLDRWL